MVNLEVEVEKMVVAAAVVAAGDYCTENTAKKGSKQEVVAAAGVEGMKIPVEVVDKSTAGVGVGVEVEEGFDSLLVHTHYSGNSNYPAFGCNFGDIMKMELKQQTHHHHHHHHHQQQQ